MQIKMAGFDPKDKNSWYFGIVAREEANSILQGENENGVFLVRDSTSIKGDFVVCVKEDNKISHYIVNKMNVAGSTKYRIGDQEFSNLSSLLQYYTDHCLDTTNLIRPASKPKFRAKFKFPGRDPDDLPFEKHDILTIIRKDEEQWWMASNERGDTGLVPVPYIEKITDDMARTTTPSTPGLPFFDPSHAPLVPPVNLNERTLPARAKVIKNRDPNAYDKTALKLKVGDEIIVTATHPSGQWEGTCKGQVGIFPFTHIKFIEEEGGGDCGGEEGEDGGDGEEGTSGDGHRQDSGIEF